MQTRKKRLHHQVIVLTGATSGIGLVTARCAAERGARLVLAARNEEALRQLTDELRSEGHEVAYLATDVGVREQVEHLAHFAIEQFGGFDTWINNAGVCMYARLMEVSLEDAERILQTNFWGTVYGSRIAVKHMQQCPDGGVLINVGSAVADRIIPLQGIYNASKGAVQSFTDTLRLELEEAGSSVAVTHIAPSAIDTPIAKNAINYLEEEPRLPPPQYAPELVAQAILHCAERPKRQVVVGAAGLIAGALEQVVPTITDRVMESFAFRFSKTGHPGENEEGVHTSASKLQERGGQTRLVLERSWYTMARLHPIRAGLLGLAAASAASASVLLWMTSRRRRPPGS